MYQDPAHAPLVPLGGTGLRDLGHALANEDGRGLNIPFIRLAELVANGADAGVTADAIVIARRRLSDAADRGNAIAADLLRQLNPAETK